MHEGRFVTVRPDVEPLDSAGGMADVAVSGVDIDELLAADDRRARQQAFLRFGAPVIGVVAFLLLWQILVAVFDVPRFVLPAPWDILKHIAGDPGFYIRNGRVTVWEASLGFFTAFVLALAAGTVMAHSPFVERASMPLAVLIQVTPIIAAAGAQSRVLWGSLLPLAVVAMVPKWVRTLSSYSCAAATAATVAPK